MLLKKLEKFGIRGLPLEWFQSYLSNRTHYAQIGNIKSASLTIRCGIPQGSTLGPLIFLLYINDLPNSADALQFRIFVDDTNIFYSSKKLEKISNIRHKTSEKKTSDKTRHQTFYIRLQISDIRHQTKHIRKDIRHHTSNIWCQMSDFIQKTSDKTSYISHQTSYVRRLMSDVRQKTGQDIRHYTGLCSTRARWPLAPNFCPQATRKS